MSSKTVSNSGSDTEENASWLPMIVIAMGQMLMSFNVAALPVSMGGMVKCFDTAPFELFGVSPARLMIGLGVVIFMSFFLWSHKHAARGKTPRPAPQVIDSPKEWAGVLALFLIVMTEAAIKFTVPHPVMIFLFLIVVVFILSHILHLTGSSMGIELRISQ